MRIAVLGGTGGVKNLKRIFEKTRVGRRRTMVSVRLDGILCCALSFGHGPRARGFEGGSKSLDYYDYCLVRGEL